MGVTFKRSTALDLLKIRDEWSSRIRGDQPGGYTPVEDAEGGEGDIVDFAKVTGPASGGLWPITYCTKGGVNLSPAVESKIAIIGPEPKTGLVVPVFYDHGSLSQVGVGYVHKIFLGLVTDAGETKQKWRTTSDGLTWTDLLEPIDTEPCP